jgi:hypothetical protein
MNSDDEQFDTESDNLLDEALSRIQAGESLQSVLEAYPEHAAWLEPLLQVAQNFQEAAQFAIPPELDEWLPAGRSALLAAAQEQQATTESATEAELLDEAIERVRAGEPTELVAHTASSDAPEFEAWLDAAAALHRSTHTPLPPRASAWLPAGRREVLRAAEQRAAPRTRRNPLRHIFSWQQLAAALFVLVLLFTVVDSVSAKSLPGDTLYAWKRTHEDLAVTLEPDPEARAVLYLSYVKRRLDEIDTLIASSEPNKQQRIDQALSTLIVHASQAVQQAHQANDVAVQQQVTALLTTTEQRLASTANASANQKEELNEARDQIKTIASQPPAGSAATDAGTTQTPTLLPDLTPLTGGTGETAGGPAGQTIVPAGVAITPTATPTARTSNGPGQAASPTPTLRPPSATPTLRLPSATPTVQPSATPVTGVAGPPEVWTNTPEPTDTPQSQPVEPTATSTTVPTATAVPITEEPTEAPPPTLQPSQRPQRPTPTATDTPVPTNTATPSSTVTPSNTPEPTDTATPSSTVTPSNTPEPSNTPTDTVAPTNTPTETPTNTATPTLTFTPTATATLTVTSTVTTTATLIPTWVITNPSSQ